MAIPHLDEDGRLPPGVHSCTLAEIVAQFGQFQGTDRRCRLAERLGQYVAKIQPMGFISALIVDGSFVTSKPQPNDIDLIVVVAHGHDFDHELRPFEYNVVSRRRVQRRYGFDVFVAEEGEAELSEYIDFFSQVRDLPGEQKGLLRIVV